MINEELLKNCQMAGRYKNELNEILRPCGSGKHQTVLMRCGKNIKSSQENCKGSSKVWRKIDKKKVV